MKIRVAVFGVGNCAKSLVEGVALYGSTGRTDGLAFPEVGGYRPSDIEFVLAYDVDRRKVGRPLAEALAARPNCALPLCQDAAAVAGVCRAAGTVLRGPALDGVAPHMADEEGFLVDSGAAEHSRGDVAAELRRRGANAALIYLPVGSQRAVEFYVEACLAAGVPFVNCIPVFIVSSPEWGRRIAAAGVPAVGDDMRSQVGASVLSQVLQEMFLTRGARVKFHCQTNAGGNTDFRNMLDRSRLGSKKASKEAVITSQNDLRGVPTPPNSVHAGPADWVPYLGDNKVAHIRLEAEGFGGAPITLDARLSVQDSPNSAGVVIDALRYVRVAAEEGLVGPLVGPSAFTQKSPPVQMPLAQAYEECRRLARREVRR